MEKSELKSIILFIALGLMIFSILKGINLFAQVSPIETKAVPVPLPPKPPLEIELKKAKDLPVPPESCKNLCGDGICQEIVCMAIGCPCPETPENCPQDCKGLREEKETKVSLFPVIQLPKTAKIEIDPVLGTPVLMEGKGLEIKGIETKAMPKISVEVQTPGQRETTVQIEIDRERKITKIEHENVVAETQDPIKIEEKVIKIETPRAEISVNVLPSIATQVIIQKEPQRIEQVSLKVEQEIPVYETKGKKEEKFLGIIPVKIPVQTKVDAQSAKIIKVKEPIWARIIDLFSF